MQTEEQPEQIRASKAPGSAPAWWLGALRGARFVFAGLYFVVAAGYLWADPRAGWTWFIVLAGGLLCCLLWWLVARPSLVFSRRPGSDGGNGTGHG